MIAAPPPVPTRDPEDVRRTAEEILGRPEFAEPGRSPVWRAIDWVLGQLDRLFGGGAERVGADVGQGGAGGSRWLTVVVLLAALAAVALLTVRARRGTWRRGRRPQKGAPPEVEVEDHRRPEAWDDLARRLEAEGRWQEGLRARFGALVGRLQDAGLVADLPGRTSGEYRADVAASLPEVATPFADAAELFERAWYGAAPTGAEEATRFAADAERVLTAARGRP